jgi:hypothetical protein
MIQFKDDDAHQQGSLFTHPVHDHHPAIFIRLIPRRLPGKHIIVIAKEVLSMWKVLVH